MAGLISAAKAVNVDPDKPNETFQGSGYDAERVAVDANDTVAGQIQSVISANSPLLRAAQTRAKQESSSRGLLNSSMAVSAGELATYNAALPIAQQDAATYYDSKKTNAAAGNAALQFNAGNEQRLTETAAGVAADRNRVNTQGAVSSRLQAEQGQIQSGLQAEQGQIQSGLQSQRANEESRLQAERGQIERDLQTADGAVRERLLNRQAEIDIQQTNLRIAGEERLAKTQGEINASLQAAQGDIERQLQVLRTAGSVELAEVEYGYRGLLQASQSASYFLSETSTAIGNILANPDIPAAQKQSLVDQQRNFLRAGLEVIGGTANLDLASLLEFSSQPVTGGNNANPVTNPVYTPGAPQVGWDGNLTPEIRTAIAEAIARGANTQTGVR